MKPRRWLTPVVTGAAFILTIPASTAEAVIIVDHSTNRTGWRISDTAAGESGGGDTWWERAADDIMLDTTATIRHVTWWGFYYYDAVPSAETMRIRFYDARPGDGLPGDVLFEENLVNPSRTMTGDIIHFVPPGTGGTALEYEFQANLPIPISLDANTPYWLEIAQDGDIDTCFGWVGAIIERTGIAFNNPDFGDWTLAGSGLVDMAFQLSTIPEPGTLALIVLGVSLSGKRRSHVR